MKTDVERKAAERERKRKAGLKRVELWLTVEEEKQVRGFVEKIRSPSLQA